MIFQTTFQSSENQFQTAFASPTSTFAITFGSVVGEGNIRKRADGRWEGRYTAGYHPETGKRIIKNVLGKTQAECKAKLSASMEATRGIDVSRADEYTVATWLRSWYEIYAKPNIRRTFRCACRRASRTL